jgi:hypothetical protein
MNLTLAITLGAILGTAMILLIISLWLEDCEEAGEDER